MDHGLQGAHKKTLTRYHHHRCVLQPNCPKRSTALPHLALITFPLLGSFAIFFVQAVMREKHEKDKEKKFSPDTRVNPLVPSPRN